MAEYRLRTIGQQDALLKLYYCGFTCKFHPKTIRNPCLDHFTGQITFNHQCPDFFLSSCTLLCTNLEFNSSDRRLVICASILIVHNALCYSTSHLTKDIFFLEWRNLSSTLDCWTRDRV